MDRNSGLEAKISREETRTTIMMDLGETPPPLIRVSLYGQVLAMRTTVRTTEDHMINAQTQHFNRNDENRSRNGSFINSNGNWQNNGNFPRSPTTQKRDYSQNSSYCQPRSDQPNNSAVRRSDNRPTTSFTPYEQKFPQNNNQKASTVVHFTTTDDTINEILDHCPLNY